MLWGLGCEKARQHAQELHVLAYGLGLLLPSGGFGIEDFPLGNMITGHNSQRTAATYRVVTPEARSDEPYQGASANSGGTLPNVDRACVHAHGKKQARRAVQYFPSRPSGHVVQDSRPGKGERRPLGRRCGFELHRRADSNAPGKTKSKRNE